MQQQEKPHVQLVMMSRWYVVSRAIQTVARLGVANHMSNQPVTITTLAEKTGTKPALLYRLMRFLSAYQLFRDEGNESFSLTALSYPLRDDDPFSMRDVLCMVDDSWWQAFSKLDTSLQTGRPAFDEQHGDDFFHFLSQHPEKQTNFDKGMAKLSTYDDAAIASAYDFSRFSSLVDMGAGRGGLVKAIAEKHPSLPITLFDTASVIEQLSEKDYPNSVRLLSGDFFKDIPKADAYTFKGVLHDFNDTMMNAILKNCHQQLSKQATLFIVEQILPEQPGPHPNKTMDIVMMVLLGGRQRSLQEWQERIEPSGFHFVKAYKTESIFTLMEFKPS